MLDSGNLRRGNRGPFVGSPGLPKSPGKLTDRRDQQADHQHRKSASDQVVPATAHEIEADNHDAQHNLRRTAQQSPSHESKVGRGSPHALRSTPPLRLRQPTPDHPYQTTRAARANESLLAARFLVHTRGSAGHRDAAHHVPLAERAPLMALQRHLRIHRITRHHNITSGAPALLPTDRIKDNPPQHGPLQAGTAADPTARSASKKVGTGRRRHLTPPVETRCWGLCLLV